MKWLTQEIELLKSLYSTDKTENILKHFPNRTEVQLRKKAKRLGLRKTKNFYKKSDCSFLLKEIDLSYYWIGFILADGSINQNNRLNISLSLKDKNHLENFSCLTNKEIKVKKNYCNICLMDKKIISKLTKKFDIHHNKTYCPPNLEIFKNTDDDKFISLLIGYIDGDGRIVNQYKRKTSIISFQVHSSWLNFLKFISDKLDGWCHTVTPKPKINKRGYAYLAITNTKLVRFLKQKCIELNLPYMKRKWDLIDETLISKYETSDIRRNLVIGFEKTGLTRKEISSKVGISESRISIILKQKRENS